MKFGAIITGVQALQKKMESIESTFLNEHKDAVIDGTLMVHTESVRILNENSDGPTMVRYNPRRSVHVSRPGDPPNTDTARLVQSIGFNILEDGARGEVGTNLKYGAWLEFGTRGTAPRPWLSVALRNMKPAIIKLFNKAHARAAKRLSK